MLAGNEMMGICYDQVSKQSTIKHRGIEIGVVSSSDLAEEKSVTTCVAEFDAKLASASEVQERELRFAIVDKPTVTDKTATAKYYIWHGRRGVNPPAALWPPEKSQVLAFRDDFNTASLDTSLWTPLEYVQEKTSLIKDNISLSNGLLRLKTDRLIKDTFSGSAVASLHVQPYGRWVARIKMPPAGLGYWPAFWMVPETYPASEVNKQTVLIAEWFGAWPNSLAVAYAENDGTSHYQEPWPSGNFSDQWHIYETDLRPDYCTISIDNIPVFRWEGKIPKVPMRIILDNKISSTPPAGPPDAKVKFPSYFEIDWVEVYE